MVSKYKRSGWFNESHRHSLARQGIKTSQKINYSTHRQRRDALIGGVGGLLVAGPIGAVAGAGAGYVVGSEKKKVHYSAEDTLKHEWLTDKRAVEAYEKNNTVIRIYQDDNPESPDDWKDDNLFLVHYHRDFEIDRDSIITKDDTRKWYQGEKIPQEKDYYIFPVEAYIHGGVSLAFSQQGNFPDRQWDVSHVGLILASKKEFKSKEKAKESAKGLLETWNQSLSGDVYGFDVSDPKTGESIESVWGFYGIDEVKKEAEDVAKNYDPKKIPIKPGQRKLVDYSTHRQRKDAVIGGVAGLLVAGPIGAVAGAGIGYGVGSKKKKKVNYMMGASYSTKKDLKESVGKPLRFVETSLFGQEYKDDGTFTVVGPDAYNDRKWYATVTMKNGLIEKVK
jgi:outer membrane lipoprotein SlyB